MDAFQLDRFVLAQEPCYDQARAELRNGRKQSHWMWFIFPQISGLGHSEMSRRYSISSVHEAAAYHSHPLLGARLIECTTLVRDVSGRSIRDIFGQPDDLKFHSCMTLFASVTHDDVFMQALRKHFRGCLDRLTLERLQKIARG